MGIKLSCDMTMVFFVLTVSSLPKKIIRAIADKSKYKRYRSGGFIQFAEVLEGEMWVLREILKESV